MYCTVRALHTYCTRNADRSWFIVQHREYLILYLHVFFNHELIDDTETNWQHFVLIPACVRCFSSLMQMFPSPNWRGRSMFVRGNPIPQLHPISTSRQMRMYARRFWTITQIEVHIGRQLWLSFRTVCAPGEFNLSFQQGPQGACKGVSVPVLRNHVIKTVKDAWHLMVQNDFKLVA